MTSNESTVNSPSRDEYSIGWIAALSIEFAAAKAMLDERYDEPLDLERHDTDSNSYACGRMGQHKVVIACLASGIYGNTQATATAIPLLSSFPNVKFGLLVGIGAGLPSATRDIRLGDVAVSQPTGRSGGVIQYDLGKALENNQWQRKDCLAKPPEVLLKALAYLQSEHELEDSKIDHYIQDVAKRLPKWGKSYAFPKDYTDRLFEVGYTHASRHQDCSNCDTSRLVPRKPRESNAPQIHYGVIASGNALVKNALLRQDIASIDDQSICLEMEAAGLMNNYPCLVIRGICDYADSHKNDAWQKYASATAAAFAKELLSYVPIAEVVRTTKAKDIIDNSSTMREIVDQLKQTHLDKAEDKRNAFLQTLCTCDHAERKDRNPPRIEGTCLWFTGHERFQQWRDNRSGSNILWVSADPGCGKSVLSRYLVDEVLLGSVCYFFFKDDFEDQRTATGALCSLLYQLFKNKPVLLTDAVLKEAASQGLNLTQSLSRLLEVLIAAVTDEHAGEIVCVLDALDECQERDRRDLAKALSTLEISGKLPKSLKFLVTSRPYQDISNGLFDLETRIPIIHLKGENDLELTQIAGEIDLVIKHEIDRLVERKQILPTQQEMLRKCLREVPNRTYLWVYLILNDIKAFPNMSTDMMSFTLTHLPQTVDDVYEKMLERSSDRNLAKRLFSIVLGSFRPLTIREVIVCLYISNDTKTYDDLSPHLEDEGRMIMTIRELSGLIIQIIDSKIYLIHQTAREFLVASAKASSNDLVSLSMMSKRSSSDPSAMTMSSKSSAMLSTSTLNSSIESQDIKKRWRYSIDLPYAHLVLAEICAQCLSLPTDRATFLELDNYAKTSLFAHLYMANSKVSKQLSSTVIDLLDKSLRPYWSLIVRHMPNYQRESVDFVPPANAHVFYLVLYLGIYCLIEEYWSSYPLVEWQPSYGHRALCLVAAKGDVEILKIVVRILQKRQYIQAKGVVNGIGLGGMTPLHAAVKCGQYDMARELIAYGANIERPDEDDARPLHVALATRNHAIVNLLLRSGADVNALSKSHGFSQRPLTQAIELKDAAIAKSLLAFGAETNAFFNFPSTKSIGTVIHYAAQFTNGEVIKVLLDHGCAVDMADDLGYTPLFHAAFWNQVEAMKVLLKHSADVKKISKVGNYSALTIAIRCRSIDAVRLLVDHKALLRPMDIEYVLRPMKNVYDVAVDWSTKLDEDFIRQSMDIFDLKTIELNSVLCSKEIVLDIWSMNKLIDAGAMMNAEILIAALERSKVYRKHSHLVQTDEGVFSRILSLLDGQNLSTQDRQGIATSALELEESITFSIMIQNGVISLADLDHKQRRVTWFLAARQGSVAMINLLLEAFVGIDEKNEVGRTALSLAFAYGMNFTDEQKPVISSDRKQDYEEVAKILLSRGADPDLPQPTGRTPMDWAELAGNTMATQLVEKYGVISSPAILLYARQDKERNERISDEVEAPSQIKPKSESEPKSKRKFGIFRRSKKT